MTVMQSGGRGGGGPSPSGLADVIETILDKGLVIDAYARVSLVGIEVLAIDARIVIASVDTYLRFAEAMDRLGQENLGHPEPKGLGDTLGGVAGGLTEGITSGGARGKSQGAVEGAGNGIKNAIRGFTEDDDEPARRRRR